MASLFFYSLPFALYVYIDFEVLTVPDVRREATQSRFRVAQQIHWPAVSSEGKFHKIGGRLELFKLFRVAERQETGARCNGNARKELVNVIWILCNNPLMLLAVVGRMLM